MLYFPRKRSMTRYFSFTAFQLRTENFAATPPASAAIPIHCAVLLLRLRLLCEGVPSDAECIPLSTVVPSFAGVPSVASVVSFPAHSWMLFRHRVPLGYDVPLQFHTNSILKHGIEHSRFFVPAKLSEARRTGGTRERNEAKPGRKRCCANAMF